MKPTEKIERLIKQLQDHTSAEHDEKTLSDIYTAMGGSKPTGDRLGIWRTIMKNRIARTAAAAIIIIGVLFGFEFFGKQIGGTSVALADMTEVMKKMPWLHGVIEGNFGGRKDRLEAWISFESQILATLEQSGEIEFVNLKKHVRYKYSPELGTVTVSYASTDEILESMGSPLDFWQAIIEQIKGTEANYTKQVSRKGHIETQFYRMEASPFEGPMEIIIFVDTKLSLPLKLTQKVFDQDKKLVMDGTATFDYPDDGPADIYSIGVPQSAEVIDRMPADEIPPIIELYKTHRQNCPSHYIAVVVDEWIGHKVPVAEQVSVVYRDDKKQRVEYYAVPQKHRSEYDLNRSQYKTEMGDSFDSLFVWWTRGEISQLGSVDLFDGKYQHQVRLEEDRWKRLPKILTLGEDHRGDDDLADFGWHVFLLDEPSSSGSEQGLLKIVENEYSIQNNVICLEKKSQGKIVKDSNDTLWATPPKRIAYYINPDRDYIRQRYEIEESFDASWKVDKQWLAKAEGYKKQSPYSRTTEVVEYGQTAEGKWYPKVIKRWNPGDSDGKVQVKTIYLETDPEFGEGVFDAVTLPE